MTNVERLRELAELLHQGAITQEEFDKVKFEIMNPPAPPVAPGFPERVAKFGTGKFIVTYILGYVAILVFFGVQNFAPTLLQAFDPQYLGTTLMAGLYLGIIPGYVGWRRGHSFWVGWVLSLLITPILALLVILFMKPYKKTKQESQRGHDALVSQAPVEPRGILAKIRDEEEKDHNWNDGVELEGKRLKATLCGLGAVAAIWAIAALFGQTGFWIGVVLFTGAAVVIYYYNPTKKYKFLDDL